jgi:hypothetical protein
MLLFSNSRAAPGSHHTRACARRIPIRPIRGGERGYPTYRRRRDPGGRTNRRDSTARTADLSTRITTAGALESKAANDWCAGRSRDPEGKVTQTINLRVVRHERARAAYDLPCERDNTKLRRPLRHRPGTGTSVPATGRSSVRRAAATGSRQPGGVHGTSCLFVEARARPNEELGIC